MIPNTRDRVVASQGVTSSGEFGISQEHAAHIMHILRDTMYSDKVLAVLREYGANAWDAHRMSGKADVPIKVTLPTTSDPSLSIRDFGPGLSKEEVFTIFTQYGASTKRTSDISVGMLGIGSKSAFAYSDSFTVISFNGGTKCIYVAVLDKSEKGVINLLHEEPCGDETGLQIQVAVRPQDIHEFEEKAKKLYKYFKPQPDINVELPSLPPSQAELKKGVIYTGSHHSYMDEDKRWKAVMGCIPYRIDLDELVDQHGARTAPDSIWDLTGVLYFEIGEVQINASREGLKYSDATKAAITSKFNEMIDEYVQQTIAGIESKKLNPWDQRVRVQILHSLKLPVPPEWEEMAKTEIDLKDVKLPKSFVITKTTKKEVTSIDVEETTRLILKNDPRTVDAFDLKHNDYLIRRVGEVDWKIVQKDLEKFCVKQGIDGITILQLSQVAKNVSYVPNVPLDRLKGKSFNLLTDRGRRNGFYSPYSPYWKPAQHVPSAEDVFVVLRKFRPTFWNFFTTYMEDWKLGEVFGFPLPEVIGYRTTKKNPVEESTVPGKTYASWSQEMREILSKRPEFIEYLKMNRLSYKYGGHSFFNRGNHTLKAKSIIAKFGEKHVISDVIARRLEVSEYFKNLKDHHLVSAFDLLRKGRHSGVNGQPELTLIKERYKLIRGSDPIGTILEDKLTGHWIKYIHAVDFPRKNP